MFCLMHNYKVDDTGYLLFCTRCGKIKTLPCLHKWVQVDTCDVTTWWPTYDGSYLTKIYILQCAKCGDMRNHYVYS